MTRLKGQKTMYNHHPFTGDGYSLYANVGGTVQYRYRRLLGRKQIGSTQLAFGATNVLKTARQGTITNGGTWPVPASFNGESAVSFDVRRFKDDVENESSNYRTQTIGIDGSGDGESTIYGSGSVIYNEAQAGGIVIIRMRFYPSAAGVQANLFRLTRTAGPTTPADITVSQSPVAPTVIEFTTAALSDASAYTYTIRAENGATTKDLVTGLSVTADATGPVAPSTATAEAW